jgi:hypothetical protein
MSVAAIGSDCEGGGVEDIYVEWKQNLVGSSLPTPMKNLRPEYLPAIDDAMVGVAGGEVLLRWLVGLKNTEEHGAAVQTPAKLR